MATKPLVWVIHIWVTQISVTPHGLRIPQVRWHCHFMPSFSLKFSHDHHWELLYLNDVKLKFFIWPQEVWSTTYSTTQVFSIFKGNTIPSTSYLAYFTGLFRPLLSGLNSMANHFNHDLISTQDYCALLTHRICSLIPSFVLTKALFVLVYISTSEPSLASSDNLSFHRFFLPYDLPSFPSLKSPKKRYPWILSKDNLSGYFFSIFSRS